jgi:hypothetical protein
MMDTTGESGESDSDEPPSAVATNPIVPTTSTSTSGPAAGPTGACVATSTPDMMVTTGESGESDSDERPSAVALTSNVLTTLASTSGLVTWTAVSGRSGTTTRLERFCMGKFQTQKLARAVVLKDAETYKKQLLFYNFSKFLVLVAAPRPQRSKKSHNFQYF